MDLIYTRLPVRLSVMKRVTALPVGRPCGQGQQGKSGIRMSLKATKKMSVVCKTRFSSDSTTQEHQAAGYVTEVLWKTVVKPNQSIYIDPAKTHSSFIFQTKHKHF